FRITDGRAVETDFTLNGSELSFTANGSGLFAIVDTSKKPQQVLPGDVNFDGKIRSDDARLVLRAVAKLETLTPFKELAADIDKNGKVNAADARKILRIYAKLE
ncbi:MAG TPA: dockerin type I repeat-containing protein, partial [Clostridiales bacterium]|nr:dockerin type I repeat-containing protein [Clostridiales bacterium]